MPQNHSNPELEANIEEFKTNTNPGSGIILGRNAPGTRYMQVLWLMGSTEAARRKQLKIDYGNLGRFVSTITLAQNGAEVDRYSAMKRLRTPHARYDLVSTSDKTDTLGRYLASPSPVTRQYYGFNYHTSHMEPEDDTPHFTPRVTGVISMARNTFGLGLAARHRRTDGKPGTIEHLKKTPIMRTFTGIDPGVGLMVHAYDGPGEPLPSFSGQPIPMPLGVSPQETAEMYWDMLNPELRVAIAVKALDGSPHSDFHIINTIED